MNWIETLQESINFVEQHLKEESLNTEVVDYKSAIWIPVIES